MGPDYSYRRLIAAAYVRLALTLAAAVASCVLMVMVCAPIANAATSAVLTSGEPAGFDALEQPQTSLVDVYFGGLRIATAPARFSPGVVRFLQPEALLAVVPHVKATPELIQALNFDLPAHADQVCDGSARPACGRLAPAVLAVIFDEAHFRADLFINPAFLSVSDPLATHYLPTPDAGFSAVSALGGVVSGGSGSPFVYGLQNRSVLSYKNAHLLSETSLSSDQGLQVETFAGSLDSGPLRYQAGLLLTPSLDFFGQGRLFGASVGSQIDTLANRELILATPIQVYLEQRCRVELYRAARLLSAAMYDAGNQLIDTSTLPDGSYEIVVRIRDPSGASHDEPRFFSRSRALPPMGHPFFQVTGGRLLGDDAEQKAAAFLQASYAQRLSRRFAVDGAVTLIGSDAALSFGASWLSGPLQVRGEAMVSTQGECGLILDAAATLTQTTAFTVNLRQTWSRDVLPPLGSVQDVDVTSLVDAPVSDFGFSDGTQLTAGVSTIWRGVQMAANISYSRYRGAVATYGVGASVEAPVAVRVFPALRAYASAAATDQGGQLAVGLRFRFSRGRGAIYGDAGYAKAPGGFGAGATADVTATQEVDTPAGLVSASGSYTHTPVIDTVGASAELRGPAGDAGVAIDQDLRGYDAGTRYTGSFLVGAAFAGPRPTLASVENGDSGVVVSVQGPKDTSFRVLVNDAPAGKVRAGAQLTLLLPSYRLYRIRLAPLGGDAVSFDTSERRVSLYPGNIQQLSWTAEREVEVFGRLVDARGLALAGVGVGGALTPVETDAQGYFQASLGVSRVLSVRTSDGGSCRVELKALDIVHNYAAIGTLTCQTILQPMTVAAR